MRACVICKQSDVVASGKKTTVTLERGEAAVAIRHVPAMVCGNCGEKYFDEATTERLLEIADAVFRSGAEMAVREYDTPAVAA